jgi:hypothetical protein
MFAFRRRPRARHEQAGFLPLDPERSIMLRMEPKHFVRPFPAVAAALLLAASACGDSSTPPAPTGTTLVRESLSGTISANASPSCSAAFRSSVDPAYFLGGSQRCMEFSRTSTSGGTITARLEWSDRRIDLDMVLNDGKGQNYRQSIAANRANETVEFVVNPGTSYAFVVYLRGVDSQFVANGGQFAGEVMTPFTLAVERPE